MIVQLMNLIFPFSSTEAVIVIISVTSFFLPFLVLSLLADTVYGSYRVLLSSQICLPPTEPANYRCSYATLFYDVVVIR